MSDAVRFPGRQDAVKFPLTPLETDAIALMMSGYSHKEMAERFHVSEVALKVFIATICDKLSVANEFELVFLALSHQPVVDHQAPVNKSSGEPETHAQPQPGAR